MVKRNQYDSTIHTDHNGNYMIGYTFNTNAAFYFNPEDYNIIKSYCWYEVTQ